MSEVKRPVEGLAVTLNDETREQTLAWMLLYRGDVTLTTRDGVSHTGYAFNLKSNVLWLDQPNESERREVAIDSIESVVFSGRDMAAGKSFDRWIKRYIDKKLAGEVAEIASDDL
ncbi:MAG: hypothetical protein QF561_03240 [Phycisphaerales bacterium]|jgi:hypothetical protein|nr:hypothetical protein [Phycisphaerales bacterium]